MDKRSPNFTATEVDFLLEAVKKYSSTIECKKTDRFGAEEKLNAWKNVEREFNSKFSHTFRSHKVLKTKYCNIKATAKQNFAFDKRQTYATGGGPLHPTATTKTDQSILEICQEAQILGKPSSYDCDANENEFTEIEIIDEFEFLEEVGLAAGGKWEGVEHAIKKEDDVKTSWTKYTPKMLKKPVHSTLKPEKAKDLTKDSWAKVADAKIERQKMEIEFIKEKHALEVEKLNLEIEFIRLKIDKLKSE